jgi:hypothetical protein
MHHTAARTMPLTRAVCRVFSMAERMIRAQSRRAGREKPVGRGNRVVTRPRVREMACYTASIDGGADAVYPARSPATAAHKGLRTE